MNEKVSIILVNWNGKHHLEKCLPSLHNIDYKNVQLILVDNGSSDGSIEFVQSTYPTVEIVSSLKNLGFAGGNNLGYEHATGDYILFLNNDTIVETDFLTKLVHGLSSDPKIGGVQSKIISMDDHSKFDSIGAFLTNTGFLYHYGYLQTVDKKYDHSIRLYTAKGACMLFRKSVIDKVGLFDPDFFAYFEETDFCHRVLIAGYKILYIPDSVIYHKIGGTSNAMNNAFIQFHSFKNRINSYVKNLGVGELLKILPLHLLLCELAAISFLAKKRPDLFFAINRAFAWNIVTLSLTLKKRKSVQALRTGPDTEILRGLKKSPNLQYYFYLFTTSLVGYNDLTIITE
jgi:GT2 family glycosyltransferase